MKIISTQLFIHDMQCADCEAVIEESVSNLPGIQHISANFSHGTAYISFDSDIISLTTITAVIGKAGYQCELHQPIHNESSFLKHLGLVVLGLAGIGLLLQLESWLAIDISVSELQQNFSYGLLFLVGVLTSFHCIGMCGSFVLSYSSVTTQPKLPAYLRHLLYGFGKTLSYTAFGALFGLFGQFIVFTLGMRSLIAGMAGAFLILYGLSMLETFSGLRRIRLVLPRFLTRLLISTERKLTNPFAIGLLNGLMIACGPLQAMYIFAAGTGSPWLGAKILAIFALGTLPIMFVFGYLTSIITAHTSHQFLRVSAIIIIALGAVMLNRSLVLSGQGYDFHTLASKFNRHIQTCLNQPLQSAQKRSEKPAYQVIYMEVDADAYRPNEFQLQKQIPVKWVINVKELTPCNKTIQVPDLQMTIELQPGLQLLEFTPTQTGTINWSCSMGMMQGLFQVL